MTVSTGKTWRHHPQVGSASCVPVIQLLTMDRTCVPLGGATFTSWAFLVPDVFMESTMLPEIRIVMNDTEDKPPKLPVGFVCCSSYCLMKVIDGGDWILTCICTPALCLYTCLLVYMYTGFLMSIYSHACFWFEAVWTYIYFALKVQQIWWIVEAKSDLFLL